MRKAIVGIVVALALVMSYGLVSDSHAKDGYGSAGCGLGSMLFGTDSSKFKQILAATTNGTFASQTFGITTGTSNCASPSPGKKATKAFIEGNREALAKDISRGSGETLASLTTIAGCSNTAAVGSTLQQNFTAIFPYATVTDDVVSENVLNVLGGEELACGNLS